MVGRSGRGDRTGRYGNTNNDHNFRDMDYRGYDQEDEETETDRPYGCDDQSLDVHDFQDRSGFQQRGDVREDIGVEGKGVPWPLFSQAQSDLAPCLLQRVEKGARREFEPLRTGQQERVRGKDGRGFPLNTTPLLGNRDVNWGRSGAERMEFNTARPREEDRLSREAIKRRVSHKQSILF